MSDHLSTPPGPREGSSTIRRHRRPSLVALLAFSACGLGSGSALARCVPEIEAEIDRLGVAERVAEIGSVTPRRFGGGGSNEGEVADYTAWIKLSDCKGHLVVRLTPTCRARSAYTTHDCRVDGLSRSWLAW